MKRAIKHVLFCQLLGSSVVEYTDATFFHQSYIHIIHLYSICHWFCFVFLILYMNIIYMYNAGKVYTCIIWKCATASDIGSSTVSFCTCCEQIQHRQSMDFLNIKQPVSDREWLTLSIDFHSMLFHPSIVFLRWYLHRLCCYWKLDKSIGLGNCIIYRQSFQDELESINFVA